MPHRNLSMGDLDLDMNKYPMSVAQLPITPSFEAPDEFARAGFEMGMPWGVAPDYNECYQQFGFAPNTLFEETSFDPFACRQPLPSGGGLVPQNYLTPNSPPVDWSGPGNALVPGHTAQSPHLVDTPSPRNTEFSYAESDAESPHRLSPRKRSVADPAQPSKRRCSQPSIQPQPEAGKDTARSSRSTRSSKQQQQQQQQQQQTATKKHSTSSTTSSTSSSVRGQASSKNQLRTASRKPKTGNSPPEVAEDDDLTTEERRARQSHNLVEKQYRNRLNQQFESLLAVLPAERRRHSLGDGSAKTRGGDKTKGGIGVDDDDRRLSKAEVLDMARQRIESLEQECLMLQNERLELLNNMSQVRHAVAKQGAGAVVT